MAKIPWKDEFSVGDAAIDHEHRELIDFINRLLDQLEKGSSPETTADLMGQLYGQITSHFALEEATMRETHYDHYANHKADHERLLDDIREIMEESDATDKRDPQALADRLSAWFTVHFSTQDARFHGKLTS